MPNRSLNAKMINEFNYLTLLIHPRFNNYKVIKNYTLFLLSFIFVSLVCYHGSWPRNGPKMASKRPQNGPDFPVADRAERVHCLLIRKQCNNETQIFLSSATGGKPTRMHCYAFGDEHNVHSKWIDQYLRAFGKQSNKQNLYAMFELNVS